MPPPATQEEFDAYQVGTQATRRIANARRYAAQREHAAAVLSEVIAHEREFAHDTFAEVLSQSRAADREWQRNLSVAYMHVGDVLVGQDKLEEALKAYRDGLVIAERLAAADHTNKEWQRDLSELRELKIEVARLTNLIATLREERMADHDWTMILGPAFTKARAEAMR